MGKKRVLVSIALSSVLAAYDFDPDKFQTTAWSEFEQQTTNMPFYVWENQNTANPPGVGVGFRFDGNNIYFSKDNTHINTNNINDIWIIGASGSRYVLLDFTDNTLRYDKIGLHFRGGSTTTGDNHYVLLNTRYTGENGNIMRGINFDPRTEYGKMMLSIIGYDTNTQGPCNANTSGGCAPVSARSLFVFRGTDVNDNILQRYYSHDFVFGTPMASEDFGVAVGSAQFKGDKIDFSGGYWDQNGENAAPTTGAVANSYEQKLVFNGADSITQDSIEFLIGSGKTTLGLYNLGTKSFNFSNLSTSSKLHLDSVGSSIAGNLLYGADSSLNLIFASSAQSLNVAREDGTTQALSSLISTSSYLGGVPNSGQGGGANGIIGIDDSAQVSFIGECSHHFGYSASTTPPDSFQFIGSADSATPTTNRVLFLNAGNLNGAIFSTAASPATAPNPLYSKINFTLFGTSVTNLNLSDYPASQPSPTTANHNTLSALFSANPTQWSSVDTNLAPHFASMTMRSSRLSGSVSLSDTAKVNLIFDGAGTHDFGSAGARITGGSADSQIIFNNANGNAAGNLNYESISGFKGKILVLNANLTSSSPSLLRSTLRAASPIATPTTRAGLASGSFSNYTHIFNGYGASVATSASAQGQSAINQVLGGFNNASGGLANYSVSDLRASTSLNTNVSSSAQNTNFVFVGTSALGSGVDLSQAAFNNVQYTFIDFGEFDLENTSKYGSATISLAGNSWARNNINVAYTGTLDVSSRNQHSPQSFYGNHLYGNTKKDVVLDFGGDLAGSSSGSSSIHKGYITGGTSDSTYIFSNIGGTLELNKTGTPEDGYSSVINGLPGVSTNVDSTNASNLQNQLILNGILFYVSTDEGRGCKNGTCATIGFRDTNIKGNLSDGSDDRNGFGIDAVFNTSGNMVENTYTDASGKKVHIIESGSAKSSSFEGSISGASKKRVTFIGADSFVRDYASSTKPGLTISGGTIDSQYNFYSVGEFTQDMVDNIINGSGTGGTGGANGAQNSVAKGSFSFDGSTTIFANIIKDASTSGTAGTAGNNGAKDTESINIGVNAAASTLSSFTQGVLMQGRLGGNITKNAAFASGSSVVINGGNSSSVYDFSFSGANGGALVVVKLDFKDSKRVTDGTIDTSNNNGNGTLHGTIKGLDGLTSIAGTLSNTIIGANSTTTPANQVRFSGNLAGAGGHWFVTESSTIDSLMLQNDRTLLTSENLRGSTHTSALGIVDLSTYDWVGRCHDGTSTCNAAQSGQNGEYDYYELVSRDLGAGFSKKTLTIGTTMGTTSNAGTTNAPTHFSSNNGVFKLGLNLAATGDKADEVIINLTQNQNTQGVGSSRIQLIQSASTAQSYQYTSGDKIYVASLTLPNGSGFDTNTFLAEDQYLGLGIFRTELRAERENNNANTMKWYLDSIQVIDIDSATLQNEVINPLEGALLTPYLNLYTETNNMAKRMGELRGANDASGAWVKLIKGALSGTNGYYANNMGVQGGFDKRTDLGGTRVYWGVVGSFMNAWGNNYGLNLQSSSFSLGFYRSALFANSSYLDIVGKYIYSQNTYATSTLSFGGRDTSGVSSAYVSAEYGMRFGIKSARGLYLQPQAEIIAGTIGGQNLRFENSLVALSVDSKASFAFIGRVGADMLSNFRFGNSGGFWRVGASLVQDFTNRGVMDIDDNVQATSARSHTIKGDFRVLLSAGLDMRISSNSRVYFEVDRSFFGNYNLAYTISAGLRYNFGVSAPRQAPQSYPNFYEKQYLDSYSTRY